MYIVFLGTAIPAFKTYEFPCTTIRKKVVSPKQITFDFKEALSIFRKINSWLYISCTGLDQYLRMKRKIDWLNHALEFLVVLIGILIAFQLNKCSDNRSKRALIGNHLEQIKMECAANEKKIANSIEQIDKKIVLCDSLMSQIRMAKNPVVIRNTAIGLLDLRTVDIAKNAYSVLVASGDIRFMDDYDIKRKTISLYNSFEKIERINNSIQNLYDTHFYPYLKSNFDLINWGHVQTDTKLDEAPYYSKEFANTVSTYRFLLSSKKRIYKEQLALLVAYTDQ